jgi:penicillin-binding protein 1A
MAKKIIWAVLILCLLIGSYIFFIIATLPSVDKTLENGVTPSPTSQILARDYSLIRAYGKFHHKPASLSEIPSVLIDALLATEDRRFYQHGGIDRRGILRAFLRNIRSQEVEEGGSTLTQQLARNIFLSNERSIHRKIGEALLARKLEQKLNKGQILEMYLNNVYFGEGAYGLGAATLVYFGKSAKELDVAECALLVGLLQAPSRYNPFNNPDLAIKRRNEVLQKMVEAGKLSESEAQVLKKTQLNLNPHGRDLASINKAPFFSQYVVEQVLAQFDIDEQTFWQRGIKVYTTLDPKAQQIAEDQIRISSRVYGEQHQGALLSLDTNGGMLAYVGGRDFTTSQYDRVSQARRSVGSLFKVFVYITAIEKGISPLAVYLDAPIQYGNWRPENYDKQHRGYMTLAHALVESNNVVAVKLINDISPEAAIKTAQKMGIKSPMEPNLSLALGAMGASLKEMTVAFNILNNKGMYVEPYAIEKIIGRNGDLLYEHQAEKKKVLERSVRDTMVELMQGVIRYGTGKAAAIDRPAAGKTGTSDNYQDAWFIGFTPEVTTGVWVGNDDNSTMVDITGGTLPASIWQAYMSKLLVGIGKGEFELAEAYPLHERDFLSLSKYNLNPGEAASWGRKVFGLKKLLGGWFHRAPEHGYTPEVNSDSQFRGMHEWGIIKEEEQRSLEKEKKAYKK